MVLVLDSFYNAICTLYNLFLSTPETKINMSVKKGFCEITFANFPISSMIGGNANARPA